MTDRPILLDTCAAIWLADGKLSARAEEELQASIRRNTPVFVSPITAWEVGMLVSKDRLVLSRPVMTWFDAVLRFGVSLAEMSPDVLVASTELRADELRDPADRIIAATARTFQYRVMTRDRPLLAYAARGQVLAIAC
ncbi:type II toxin-antitoxin system VapC family toxin [Brevundimonas sp.]|uniref:type II toxin-antitoxin system VapC family toxin n=1 Tax=Brevundimonas sp. TaxID=1871086 RepID=UPI002AC98609|nr:type II toxin-antitoxin system VapC family toxin [Brevundimonas sp.]